MGGQVWKPKDDDEASKREEADRAATWRLQKYMQSVTGGSSTGRVFDWGAMPRMTIWR